MIPIPEDEFDLDRVLEALRDAELDRNDLNIIVNALETFNSVGYNYLDVLHETGMDEGDAGEVIGRVSETTDKIRRAVDVAYPPANRMDNQEAGI